MAELQVYMNEERDEITACQLGVFDGWRINVRQPTNPEWEATGGNGFGHP